MPNYRPTWVEINSSSLIKNINSIKLVLSRRSKILAVVKANAYGHDSLFVSRTLNDRVYGFGVATIEEGIILREGGVKKPIVILGTLWPFENFKVAASYNLIPTISSIWGVHSLEKTSKNIGKNIPFYLEVDTGMGRIGVKWDNVKEILGVIKKAKTIKCECIYSHFSSADSHVSYSRQQMKRFSFVRKTAKDMEMKPSFSMANSAGLFRFGDSHLDIVRPGISIYGLSPFSVGEKTIKLFPALSWKTRIVFLKKVSANSPISYSRRFITKTPSMIATLPVGYADGYRVALTNNSRVLIRGKFAPVVGRVTMDMIMVDVTKVKEVNVGDEVVLIGTQGANKIAAEELAERLSTINYEITCGISYRVPRVLV